MNYSRLEIHIMTHSERMINQYYLTNCVESTTNNDIVKVAPDQKSSSNKIYGVLLFKNIFNQCFKK